MREPADTPAKTFATRLFHMALASTVISQLLSSLAMQVPRNTRPGNGLYVFHEYSGLAAVVLALGFWIVVLIRQDGTRIGTLVPWFSSARRADLFADLLDTYGAFRSSRLPEYRQASPLASAIHGLGLLLMTGMATSGAIYYVAGLYGLQKTLLAELVINLHSLFGNVAWAYLIGHASMAAVHQLSGDMRIPDMWSLKSKKK